MIRRAPLKTDPPGKCNRWHVIVYNRKTRKHEWHTVRGTRGNAKDLERRLADAKHDGDSPPGHIDRRTFEEVSNLFLEDRYASNRRPSTLHEYRTELTIRLLPSPDDKCRLLGPRAIRDIKRADMRAHFNALRNTGWTGSQVNKSIKTAKAIFAYAFDSEYVTFNIMHRYPKLQRVDGERRADRAVFTEAQLRRVFASATPFELALFGTLSLSGLRPGEVYALDWPAVHLDVEQPYLRVDPLCQCDLRHLPSIVYSPR